MRWFNWVGLLMVLTAVVIAEGVFLYAWERFNVWLISALAVYMIVALGLSLWGGPSSDES